ncbi:hypothetical protein K8I61_17265 [bacterium]|nr:hypothetical protein [bacterium]
MAAEEFEVADGPTLEDIVVLVDGVPLMTCQNADWEETQEKPIIRGPGGKNKNPRGRVRKQREYKVTFDCTGVNAGVLERPEDVPAGAGDRKSFFLNGKEYKSLLDLKNVTIQFRYPEVNGSRRTPTFKGFEFTKNAGSMSLDDAEGRSLEGDATSGEGLI